MRNGTKTLKYNVRTQAVTSLGHQGARRVFCEGAKFFKLCPIVLNYVQHIFLRGAKNSVGAAAYLCEDHVATCIPRL